MVLTYVVHTFTVLLPCCTHYGSRFLTFPLPTRSFALPGWRLSHYWLQFYLRIYVAFIPLCRTVTTARLRFYCGFGSFPSSPVGCVLLPDATVCRAGWQRTRLRATDRSGFLHGLVAIPSLFPLTFFHLADMVLDAFSYARGRYQFAFARFAVPFEKMDRLSFMTFAAVYTYLPFQSGQSDLVSCALPHSTPARIAFAFFTFCRAYNVRYAFLRRVRSNTARVYLPVAFAARPLWIRVTRLPHRAVSSWFCYPLFTWSIRRLHAYCAPFLRYGFYALFAFGVPGSDV